MNYLYLGLDLAAISVPLIASFYPKAPFYKRWGAFLPALLITAGLFIIWDVIFTDWGVWGFSEPYLIGVDVLNLPLEEWLFFICIPYACVFSYHALSFLIKKDYLASYAKPIILTLAGILFVLALIYHERAYTFTTFLSTSIFLFLHVFVFKSTYLGRFLVAYLFTLIPFFLINGILTGSFIPDQVVWYNNAENLGIRMGTIPVEDSMYGFLLILMNISLMEYFERRKA